MLGGRAGCPPPAEFRGRAWGEETETQGRSNLEAERFGPTCLKDFVDFGLVLSL